MPLQHGEGRAQVVGEGCVQPFALLYGIPHLPVVLLQLLAHGLKGLTEPAQLVRALIVNLEVQVILGNLPGGLVQDLKRLLHFPEVEDQGKQAEAEGIPQNGRHIVQALIEVILFPLLLGQHGFLEGNQAQLCYGSFLEGNHLQLLPSIQGGSVILWQSLPGRAGFRLCHG